MAFFGGGGASVASPVNMVGATTTTAGTAGYAPAPAAGSNSRALFSDATFSELPMLPQYKNTATGNFILGYDLGFANTATPVPNNLQRRFTLVFIPSDGSVDVLGFRQLGGVNGNCHVAMWACGNDGLPSSLIVDGVGASGTTANTNISISVTPTAVKRGFCWMSWTSETGLINVLGISNSNFGYNNFLGTDGISGTSGTLIYTTTTYNQTTHGTFLLSLSVSPIRLGFQYV